MPDSKPPCQRPTNDKLHRLEMPMEDGGTISLTLEQESDAFWLMLLVADKDLDDISILILTPERLAQLKAFIGTLNVIDLPEVEVT